MNSLEMNIRYLRSDISALRRDCFRRSDPFGDRTLDRIHSSYYAPWPAYPTQIMKSVAKYSRLMTIRSMAGCSQTEPATIRFRFNTKNHSAKGFLLLSRMVFPRQREESFCLNLLLCELQTQ